MSDFYETPAAFALAKAYQSAQNFAKNEPTIKRQDWLLFAWLIWLLAVQ